MAKMGRTTGWTLALGALLASGACSETPTSFADEPDAELIDTELAVEGAAVYNGKLPKRTRRWIRRLRRKTRPYRNFDKAVAAGWSAQLSPCVESPAGGMGFHYGNPGLIDGVLQPLRPEILLYEPTKRGGLRFVGVEYVVPLEAWTKDYPPSVKGVELHPNEELGLWVLHVWTRKYNPTGIFEDFNPRVSCKYAPPL